MNVLSSIIKEARSVSCSLGLLVLGSTVPVQALEAPTILIKDKGTQKVLVTSANTKVIEYRENKREIDRIRKPINSFTSVYFLEPESFNDAMNLYLGRSYKEAKEAFIQVQKDYKSITEVSGNYATLAHYYEMECVRKMMDLERLEKMREKFISDALIRSHHKVQLELNGVFWNAVRTKGWTRLIALEDSLKDPKYTLDQRAQIAYCIGLAYEKTEQINKSLNFYNQSIVSDAGGSEVVAKESIKGILRQIADHPKVKEAIKHYGTEEEDPYSEGRALLEEGAAMVELWNQSYGQGESLPKDHADLIKYKKKK